MTRKHPDKPLATDVGRTYVSAGLTAPLLIGLITFAVFAPTIAFDFTNWDDGINVYENPYLNPVTGQNLWSLWANAYRRLYVPLAYTSFALDAALWGMKPAGFHFTNTLLHALSAVVVFCLLRRLLNSTGGAVIGALLFALHPLQVEPTAWVTGRKDVLSGLLSLLALQQYVRWSQTGKLAAYLTASLAFVLALPAKPAAVAVPLMILALHWSFLRHPGRRNHLVAVLPWLVVAAAWTLLTMRAQPPAEFGDPPVPLWQRPFVAGDALVFYLGKLFLPVGLVAVYDRPPASVLASWWIYTTPIVPLVLGALLWRSAAALRTGGALVLAGLLPVLGLARFTFQDYSTVADRYFYLSMLGVALAAGWLYAEWKRPGSKPGTPTARRLIAGGVLVVLAALTLFQQQSWRNSERLWSRNLKWKPDCPLANYNLGKIYSDRDLPAQAVSHYLHAVEFRPDYMKARHNLANDLYRLGLQAEQQGQPEQARQWYDQSEEQFEYQLKAEPDVSSVYFNASLLYSQLGDQARAEELLRKAIQYPPPLADAHVNLGNIFGHRGEYDAAIQQYQQALQINPHQPQALANLKTVRELKAKAQPPPPP